MLLLMAFCLPTPLLHDAPRPARVGSALQSRILGCPHTAKRGRFRACVQHDTAAAVVDVVADAASSRLPAALQALAAPLRAEPTAALRYVALIELGARLPRAPPRALASCNRVAGCVSLVHVEATLFDGTVTIHGAADTAVARGLVTLLALGTHLLPVDEFLALQARDIATAAALPGVAVASRAAALTRVLAHAQAQVLSATTPRTDTAVTPVPRWTDVGDADTAVLLSGGVDSAVALRLAQRSGRRVRAFYLRIWLAEEEAHLSQCPWAEDVTSARAVCEQAGVPFEQVSLQEEYRARVVRYVVSEAQAGRTPNPDVMCNSRVKFGAFLEHVGSHFPAVVSGHYARVDRVPGALARLLASPDAVKDQTYFLAGLSQAQVARAEFPLGDLRKTDVRALAKDLLLPNHDRPDSQGVCFLGKLRWEDFLRVHLGERRGNIVEWESGDVLGSHDGFWFYTLGQRRGIRLPDGPWYVVSKNVDDNIVYVSKAYWGHDHGMERRWFEVENTNWIAGEWPIDIGQELSVRVKVRHGPNMHEATLRRASVEYAEVRLATRDKALAPGQFAVFYRDNECLGCGAIATHFERPGGADLTLL